MVVISEWENKIWGGGKYWLYTYFFFTLFGAIIECLNTLKWTEGHEAFEPPRTPTSIPLLKFIR